MFRQVLLLLAVLTIVGTGIVRGAAPAPVKALEQILPPSGTVFSSTPLIIARLGKFALPEDSLRDVSYAILTPGRVNVQVGNSWGYRAGKIESIQIFLAPGAMPLKGNFALVVMTRGRVIERHYIAR